MTKETVDKYHAILSDKEVDFDKFTTKIVTPAIINDKFSESIAYQFQLGNYNDGLDYFEVAFKKGIDCSKIYSANVVIADRMPEVIEKKLLSTLKVIHGAEEESIPNQGEVEIQRNPNTGFVNSIKYRNQ